MLLRAWVNRVVSVNWKDKELTIFLEYQATTFHSPSSVWVKAIFKFNCSSICSPNGRLETGNVGSWSDETLTFLQLCTTLYLNGNFAYLTYKVQSPGGEGTWPMFGYRGAAEGLKSWPCLGQKYAENPTLCRTTTSILRPCLGQATKCTLAGFTGIYTV